LVRYVKFYVSIGTGNSANSKKSYRDTCDLFEKKKQ
jgi:hypothetical protein